MLFVFDGYELDIPCGELRRGPDAVPLEPRAFALLSLLVDNHDRLVSREELIEKAWDGRVVSDAAIATAIKSVRKALGDDGEAQRYVKTIRGRGYRFVGKVRIESLVSASVSSVPGRSVLPAQREMPVDGSRPSIAVLPFNLLGNPEAHSAIADAVPAELISSLSRLRWLWVVARASSFRFRGANVDFGAIRVALGARYCLSGVVEIFGKKVAIVVEMADTRSSVVVWGERFQATLDDIHETRSSIVNHIIASLELHIPLHESDTARLKAPDDLDAWSEYHIGLQHMYRFNQKDNAIAAVHFEKATRLDSRFARAYAALSFTSFQDAFLEYTPDGETSRINCRRYAERSVDLDPVDPFGSFNLARTYWLDGNPDAGNELLQRAVQLSPSFAQGFYAQGWADVMAGHGAESRQSLNTAMALSPLDPFLYAMQSTRGLSHLVEGDYESAANWAERGARSPGAHFLIGAIAAAAHQLNGNKAMTKVWLDNVRARRPDVSQDHFFRAFPFTDDAIRKTMARALTDAGF